VTTATTATETPDARINRLTRLAIASMDQGCLDRLVVETAQAEAASEYPAPTPAIIAAVLDAGDRVGGEINLEGPAAQVRFLVDGGMSDETIESVIAESPSWVAYYAVLNSGVVKAFLGSTDRHPTVSEVVRRGNNYSSVPAAKADRDFFRAAQWKEGL
jgi:hypothetical protein